MLQEDYNTEYIKNAIVNAMKAKGVSQRQLALKVGIHYSAISRIFDGEFNPKLKVFLAIVHALDLDITELVA